MPNSSFNDIWIHTVDFSMSSVFSCTKTCSHTYKSGSQFQIFSLRTNVVLMILNTNRKNLMHLLRFVGINK